MKLDVGTPVLIAHPCGKGQHLLVLLQHSGMKKVEKWGVFARAEMMSERTKEEPVRHVLVCIGPVFVLCVLVSLHTLVLANFCLSLLSKGL